MSAPEFLNRDYVESLQKKLFAVLKPKEHLFLAFAGESSQFIRINGSSGARIRQIGTVADGIASLTLVFESQSGELHKAVRSVTLSGLGYADQAELLQALQALQREARELPADPYAQLPMNRGQSSTETHGRIPSLEDAPDELAEPSRGLDIAGIYSAGTSVRAVADSAGTFHWFSTDTFIFDHSIYTPDQRAVKAIYAGKDWDRASLASLFESSQQKLELLRRPARRIERGSYRAYLEPAAVRDLLQELSYGALSESAIRQGDSPLQKLRSGQARLSPLFTLSEDFRGGESPRFNEEGELARERLVLIERGELKQTLVSARTAKEYALESTFAATPELVRAPSLEAGTLSDARLGDILERLGTGLYLSNLHYLNWSDQPGGRVTGMTRYACFWVESGKIACPIENMRFDDTIFRFFGDSLEALGETRVFIPDSMSYGMRALGGVWTPGALLSEMIFTL